MNICEKVARAVPELPKMGALRPRDQYGRSKYAKCILRLERFLWNHRAPGPVKRLLYDLLCSGHDVRIQFVIGTDGNQATALPATGQHAEYFAMVFHESHID